MSLISKYRHFLWSVALLSLVLGSCSTEKDAWLNKKFHNTTARYNGYFNAREIMKETLTDYANGKQDDYNKIIPVFEYPDEAEAKSMYPTLKKAVEKCETVIVRHSMPKEKKGQFRGVEWCDWIDDNWLAIGEAKFYLKDFSDTGAVEKFDFINKTYEKSDIIYHARLWKAKSLIEQEEWDQAEEILKEMEEAYEDQEKALESGSLSRKKKKASKSAKGKPVKEDDTPPLYPKDFDREFLPVYADLYLRQGEDDKAIEKLEKAIEVVKKRQFRTRLIFILAQVHHKKGDQKASDLYAEVIKLNPEYSMAFQAKINQALAFTGGNMEELKEKLHKMLKDEKNVEYLDQIYYALADIALRENEREDGIHFLELSVSSSTSNNDQKSKSFLRLGKLYYEDKNYLNAQKYYDSTMAVLPKEHEEYDQIELRSASLSELVSNLNVMHKEDSIIAFCALPEKEKINQLEEMIEKLREEDEKRQEAQEALANSPFPGGIPKPNGGGISATFWVWDNNLRGVGFNDFKSNWGTRKLEDNWRRADKSSSSDEPEVETEQEDDERYSVDFYLDQLPCEDTAKMNASTANLVKATYNAGSVYRFKLEDDNEAQETFEKLEAYLPAEDAISGMYQLYLLHDAQNNNLDRMKYKDLILNDYPKSEYAKLIRDPNYKQKEDLAKIEDKADYIKTYEKYSKGFYESAKSDCQKVIKTDSTNGYFCKYLYLNALCTGQLTRGQEDKSQLEDDLEHVLKSCFDEKILNETQALLDRIRKTTSTSNAAGSYKFDPALKHYFVLVIPAGKANTNEVSNTISNFNASSFPKKNLNTSTSILNSDLQLIMVKAFKNKAEAMDYYGAFKVNKTQVKPMNEAFEYFVISNKNFGALYVEKSTGEYISFFEKMYLSQ